MKLCRTYYVTGSRTINFTINEETLQRIQGIFDELCIDDVNIKITMEDIKAVWNGDEGDSEKLDTIIHQKYIYYNKTKLEQSVGELIDDILNFLIDTEPFDDNDDEDIEYEVANDFIEEE